MGKKKFLKWLIPLSFGAVMMGTGIFAMPTNVEADSYTTSIETPAYRLNAVASINNPTLRDHLRKVFNKTSYQSLNTDEFMKSALYAPTKTTNPDTQEETTTIPTRQIDLSGTGITDIRELAQFELPENIEAINLSGNGITNDHLADIVWLLNQTKGSTVEGKSYKVGTDFSTQIKKVLLNDNQIDISTISDSYLNNDKLIFGVQMIKDIHTSGLVLKGEVDPQFYVRESDLQFLSFGFTNEMSVEMNKTILKTEKYGYGTRVRVSTNGYLKNLNDEYKFRVYDMNDNGYFKGYNFEVGYTQFTISIDEKFEVERGDSSPDFGISSQHELLEGSPIKIDGFGDNSSLKVSRGKVFTTKITKHKQKEGDEEYINKVDITIEKNGKSRTVQGLEYIIVDNIKPVIKLNGSSHMYISRNKDFKDPGVIAFDPTSTSADDIANNIGDDRSSFVKVSSDLDITKIGTYTITYTVADEAGNVTTKTRTVEVQERVLDTIILRVNTEDISDGDDVVLVVQPDANTPVDKYEDYQYYWYMNGVRLLITQGDKNSGRGTTTIIADGSIVQDIHVELRAKQKSDGAEIIVYSEHITLDVSPSLRNDNTMIIAVAIAVLIIFAIFVAGGVIKYKKSRGKTHGKHKNFHKGKKPKKGQVEEKKDKGPEIQVIRNYTGSGTGNTDGTTGGESGDANTKPQETEDKGGMKK